MEVWPVTERSADFGSDEVRDYLAIFAADFNAGRLERMPDHYAATFSAVVDGEFVDRNAYLSSIAALVDAGYARIGFELRMVQALSPDRMLADGTTTIRSPEGDGLVSRFSIVCERSSSRLMFAYSHSSRPRGDSDAAGGLRPSPA
jgi:hypothetical protein